MSDPWELAKEQLSENMKQSNALYQRHQQLMGGGLSSATEQEELNWVRNELNTKLADLEDDVGVMQEAVRMVEGNRARYGVEHLELEARKLFVEQTRKEIKTIKENCFNKQVTARIQKKQREQLLPASGRNTTDTNNLSSQIDNVYERDNQEFMDSQKQVQKKIIDDQNVIANAASDKLDTIKDVALDMNTALKEQHKDIDQLHNNVQTASSVLDRVQKRLGKFMEADNDKTKIVCIVVLVIIIFVMVLGIVMLDMI